MEFIIVLLIFIICIQTYNISEKKKEKEQLEVELKIKQYEIMINDENLKHLVSKRHCINCKYSLYIGFNTLTNGEIFCDDLSNQCLKYNMNIKELEFENFSGHNPAVYCKFFSIKDTIVYDSTKDNILDKFKPVNNIDTTKQENSLDENNSEKLKNKNENIDREKDREVINFDELINKAKKLAHDNIWDDEAIRVNNAIIEFDSSCSAAYTRLAKCYVIKKEYERAEKLYREVLSFDSNNIIAENRLNDLLTIKDKHIENKFNEIISYLQKKFKEHSVKIDYDEEFFMFYHDYYNPYRGGNNNKFRSDKDGDILKLKNNNRNIIEKYSKLLDSKLNGISNDLNNIVIISIPSSRVGNENGITMVAKNIAKTNRFIDNSSKLMRFSNIEKLATGGDRSKYVHINSIKYENNDIDLSNKIIILIDDVITTGNSLIASREILMRLGAKYILGLGICKTYFETDEILQINEDDKEHYYCEYLPDSELNDEEIIECDIWD